MMKKSFFHEMVAYLETEDVKKELHFMLRPIIDIIIQEIQPYIYLTIIFISLCFLLILGIFILLIHNKYVYRQHLLL
jgi:hypothetical protein